jgi:hypothetical protein
MNSLILLFKKHVRILISNVLDSEKLTYYPEAQRKGVFRILLDNLLWFFRFGHANEYYYILGFDRIDHRQYEQKFINGRTCKKWLRRRKLQLHPDADSYDVLVHDKFVASRYLQANGFPTPKTIALACRNTLLFPESGEEHSLEEALDQKKSLFSDCICKPVTGYCGIGIFRLCVREDGLYIDERKTDLSGLRERLSDSLYLIEERIIQHERMAILNPDSVNTIRLVTCIHQGHATPFSAGVRIGVAGKVTDNWHTGGILIRLNMEKGCLEGYGYTLPEFSGNKFDRHPATGVAFDGYEIPYAREAVQLAIQLHQYFYFTHAIGWDIALTANGPVFIEANQGWDPYVHLVLEDRFKEKFHKFFG